MYKILKPLLFKLDPETAHNLIIKACSTSEYAAKLFPLKDTNIDMSLKVGNCKWSFPVGLAAGLDKNGECIPFFSKIGFGAVEVGTVTPKAQAGNDKPRIWRYPQDESLRNRMGFNNQGSEFLMNNVLAYHGDTPLGVNIGKNKVTPDELAYEDYALLYEKFNKNCDYIVINVSSPNTPGLREHQSKEGLESILSNIKRSSGDTDLFVKISPDINPDSITDIVELVKKYELTGLIATNTTIVPELGEGGVSGKLLYDKSREIRKRCLGALQETPDIEFIGVGGFSNYSQILDYWKMGGRALQIYSSFIFQGPQVLRDIQNGIEKSCSEYQVDSLEALLEILHK